MENTEVKFDKQVLTETLKGAEVVFKAVSKTMGRHGGFVAINDKFHEAYLTKDGWYAARSISLKDKTMNQGVSMMKIAAKKTADKAGDGTTTTTVLTYNMYKKAIDKIEEGYVASDIMKGMQKASDMIADVLKRNAIPVKGTKEIKEVATVSANNNEEIGGYIAEAMSKIKLDGSIIVEEAKGIDTTIDVVDGMKIESGYLAPHFVTDEEKMITS